MSSSIMFVDNLSVRYGKNEVLTDISFTVDRGDYIGIVGPNGSGKTTLVKTIIGLLDPFKGEIRRPEDNAGNKSIGYLPQKAVSSDKVFPAQVAEIISTGLFGGSRERHWRPQQQQSQQQQQPQPQPQQQSQQQSQQQQQKRRWGSASADKKIQLVLDKLRISDLKNKKIGSLSGGQQQRVLLARALVGSPQILVLDEPTSALDPHIREDFYGIIDQLNKEDGVTVLLVSHDIASIGKYTKKLLYIDRRLIFFGTYDEFCKSKDMTEYFGFIPQHQFCWRHADGKCNFLDN